MNQFFWVKLDCGSWVIAELCYFDRWFIPGVSHVLNRKSIGTSGSIIEVGEEVICPYKENSSTIYNEIKEKPTNLGKTPKVARPVPP